MADKTMAELLMELKLEVSEDTNMDFTAAVRCGALARIVSGGRNTGVAKGSGDNFDFLSLKLQLVDIIDGEEHANGRYLDKSYSLLDKTWDDGNVSKGSDNVARLLKDLFTAGLEFPVVAKMTDEELVEALTFHLTSLTDKVISVRCYPTKSKKQAVKIVKEIVKKGELKKNTNEVPF